MLFCFCMSPTPIGPAPERVHPLLPWALQRALKMPGSDPALAASNCRALTESLLRSSSVVLFCHAAENENGKLRPSPILDELGIESINAVELNLYAPPFDHVDSEIVADDGDLPPLPSYEVGGGASVLKLQAACGFLAFAELRLRATEPRTGTMGLDAGESGSLLHRVLQYFWRETKTQDRLRLMSSTERDEILMRAIDSALPSRLKLHDGWGPRVSMATETSTAFPVATMAGAGAAQGGRSPFPMLSARNS